MAKVDPFVIQWPRKWVEDPEIGPVIEYLNRFLHDLWVQTGGGEDLIEESGDAQITTPLTAGIGALQKSVDAIEQREPIMMVVKNIIDLSIQVQTAGLEKRIRELEMQV